MAKRSSAYKYLPVELAESLRAASLPDAWVRAAEAELDRKKARRAALGDLGDA